MVLIWLPLSICFKYISESNFSKVGGIPIPDKIKEKARESYEDLKKALEQSDDVLEKLQQNNQAFDKIKDKPEQVKSYKGLYQQSCRRNAKRWCPSSCRGCSNAKWN